MLTNPSAKVSSGRIHLALLLLAAGGVSIANGLVLPLLAQWADADVRHVAALVAIYPLGAAVAAPLWARVAERMGLKPILVLGLVGYAAAFAALGQTDIAGLYAIRLLAGVFAAAVLPTTLALATALASDEQHRAHQFTWLYSAILAGDLGALLGARSVGDGAVLWAAGVLATIAGATAVLAPHQAASSTQAESAGKAGTSLLLAIAIVAGAAIALLHTAMVTASSLTHGTFSWLLGGCGLVMLAAQVAPITRRCLASAASRFLAPILLLLAVGLGAAAISKSLLAMAVAFLLVGWSAASLRLGTAFLAARGGGAPPVRKLGSQFSATAAGQAVAAAAVISGAGRNLLAVAALLILILGAVTLRQARSMRAGPCNDA